MERGQVLGLPCLVGSLRSLGGGEDLVLVKLLVPNNGTAAWVNKRDVTIVEQPAWGGALRALVKSTFIDQTAETYIAEIIDRSRPRQIEIPKAWLKRELSNYRSREEVKP